MSVGQDTSVNTYTTNDQFYPATTALADGGWVAVWLSFGQDGDTYGVYQQRYAADGAPVGEEIHVSTTTTGSQSDATVTALDGGGWVVVWEAPGTGKDIYMQRYDADGEPDGVETRVNALTTDSQPDASVTALSDGGFVVSWTSSQADGSSLGIMSRRYDADGIALADESLVNSYTTASQANAATTQLSDGGWIIAWTSDGQDGDSTGIYQQRYNEDGAKHGAETRVNSFTSSYQGDPAIAALADGGWIIAWVSDGQDGDGNGIYMQRFDADGGTVGDEALVNTTVTGDQYQNSLAALADGGWVVTWTAAGPDDGISIYQTVYDADGNVVVAEMEVNTPNGATLHYRELSSVAGLADGGWIVNWSDYNEPLGEYDVRQQRFEADGQFYGVNDRPFGTDRTVRLDENYAYAFKAGDFGFHDATDEDNLFAGIVIAALPKIGRLTLDGAALHAGDRIDAADLGDLAWTPPRHGDGDALARFKFKVVDDGGTEGGGLDTAKTASTITFNVKAAIEGTAAGETLKGTGKHDVLDGRRGDDTLTGRAGSDIFVFGTDYERDTLTDFDAGSKNHDIVDLGGLSSIKGFADLRNNHMSRHGGDVWIDGGHGDVLVLQDVDLKDLGEGRFLF
jgi:hypothetical protein